MAKRFNISDKALKTEIKNAASKAIRENKALGIPTTVLVDGDVVEITPNGTIRIVSKLNLVPSRKLTKRHFTLG